MQCNVKTTKKSLRVGLFEGCTIQIDYAENCSCCYVNEASAVYNDKHQVSIHHMIHYRDGDGALQHQSIVGITQEKGHTMAMNMAFLQALQSPLKAILQELTHIHYATDSPSSQYRNKTAIAMVTNHESIFGTNVLWKGVV